MSYRFADSYFLNKTLHVSDSSSVHHQEFFTVNTGMAYVIQFADSLLASCQQTRYNSIFGIMSSSQLVLAETLKIAASNEYCNTVEEMVKKFLFFFSPQNQIHCCVESYSLLL